MERLTVKTKYGYENECKEITLCSDKLGPLEDIEEELGIDFITLLKALKQGIWLKNRKDQFIPYHCLLRDDFILVLYEDIYKDEYLLKDYGKTWALSREELENERKQTN